MARKLAAGNWKMNGTSADLAEISAMAREADVIGCDLLICPPATLLHRAAALTDGKLRIGGQDCHGAATGAHTGDLSAAMLSDAGAETVILGHSERRSDHGETDADVATKLDAALKAGLSVILCVGESEEQREAGDTLSVVLGQLDGSLPGGIDPGRLVVAYEPVWAIGTGKVAQPSDIEEVHGALRAALTERFGDQGTGIPLLYGGSVKPENAAEVFATPEVNGALVGGASLSSGSFLAIARALADA